MASDAWVVLPKGRGPSRLAAGLPHTVPGPRVEVDEGSSPLSARIIVRSGSALFVVSCLLAPANRAAGQSIMLKPRLEVGQKYYVEKHRDFTQKAGELGTRFRTVNGAIEEVKAVSEEGIELLVTLERCAYYGNEPFHPQSFETDLGDERQSLLLRPILRTMIGSKLTLKLNQDFDAGSCTGADKILRKIEKKAARNDMWIGIFKGAVRDDAYLDDWGRECFLLYPNREVKVGETWNKSHEEKNPELGRLRHDYRMTLKSVEEKEGRAIAVVTFSEEISKTGDSRGGDYVFRSGEVTGSATFDSKLGRWVTCERRFTESLEGEAPRGSGRLTRVDLWAADKIDFFSLKEREAQRDARRRGTAEPPTTAPGK